MKPKIWRSYTDTDKYIFITYQTKPDDYLEYSIQISKDNPNMGNIYLHSAIANDDKLHYIVMLSRHYVQRKNWRKTMAELTGFAMAYDFRKDMAKFINSINKEA